MFNRLYDYIVLTIYDLLLFPFQFIFSTATDGKIKAWLYDTVGSRVDYDAPGHSSTTMAYSADGTRLAYFLHPLQSHSCFSDVIFFISFMCDIIMDIFVSSLNNIGCSHVGQIKKVIHTWWSGMKVKEL